MEKKEVLISHYRPLLISILFFPILNYLVHVAFGWAVIPIDYISRIPATVLPDARLSESWNSLMAIIYLQMLLTGILLIFTLFRQILSIAGLPQVSRVRSVPLMLAAIAGFFMVLFSGPINPDLLFLDDPKVSGDSKWFFVLVVSFCSGGVSSLIVSMTVDPNTLNENFEKSRHR
jgi:hypothetical protein